MAELPQNWQKEYLTNICNVYQPKTISTKELLADGSYPVYGANGQIGYYDKYNHEFSEVLITCRGATCGNINKSVPKSWINGNAMVASPISNAILDKNYLFYYLKNTSFADYISGTAQPQITRTSLTKMPVIYPPLNEQKRIVEKLDKMMRIVDDVNARLDKIPTALKRARQSILNQAITGELTKDWREKRVKPLTVFSQEDINEAKMAYYMQLCEYAKKNNLSKPKFPKETKISDKKISDLPEIPNTWKYYRLFDISNLITDGTHKTPKYVDSGIPFLSVKNVRPFKINDSDIKYITAEESMVINLRCNPEIGDILYTKVGATYGYAAQINLDYDFSIFVSLALIKPVKQYFISSYAEIVLNSEIVFQQAREKISGIAVPDLHLIEIKDFRIPLPPLEEQTEIVRRVKLAFEKLDKIESRYQKAKEYSDKLTQSILNKAFRGELVSQDPNDKPISLDDIQVQIAEKPSKKRKTLKNNKVQEMAKEIIEILKEYPEGISPEELFKNSKYSQKDFTDDDIIEFYKELSNLLDSKLTEEKDSVNHKILIKKVK